MSSRVAFHEKLVSVMEALANAAVAEICQLVEDGYALLRLEVSRRQKENEELRTKLQTMELLVRRARRGQRAERQCVGGGGHVRERRLEQTHLEDRPVHREAERPAARVLHSSAKAAVPDTRPHVKEYRGDPQLIKEETPEELCGNSDDDDDGGDASVDGDTKVDTGKQRTVEGLVAHMKRLPVVDPSITCAEIATGLSEQQMGHGMWGGARSETLLKLEPGGDSVKEMLGHTQSGGKVEGLSLNIGSSAHERSAQLVRVVDVVVDDQPCTEVTDSHTCVQPELGGAGAVLPSSGVSGAESDVAMEYVMCSAWSKDLGPGMAQTQHRYYAEDGQRTDIPSKSGASMCSPHAPAMSASQCYGPDANGFLTPYKRFNTAPESTKTYRKFETRGKVFVCKFCGKCCTRSSNLKRHQRVHTGEKPFSCTLCGKKFTQSCSLKRHQSVHTGARPFHCPRCRKQFSHSSDVQKHQCSHWRKTV